MKHISKGKSYIVLNFAHLVSLVVITKFKLFWDKKNNKHDMYGYISLKYYFLHTITAFSGLVRKP